MSQLRLAYVNCRIVWRPTKRLSGTSMHSPTKSDPLPPLAVKAARLAAARPAAAEVIEKLVDELLAEVSA